MQGLNIGRNIILVMMLSGALAGLAGMSEISGVVHRLQERISPGYGFTGIIVAWLAKTQPLQHHPRRHPLWRPHRGRSVKFSQPALSMLLARHHLIHDHQQRYFTTLPN